MSSAEDTKGPAEQPPPVPRPPARTVERIARAVSDALDGVHVSLPRPLQSLIASYALTWMPVGSLDPSSADSSPCFMTVYEATASPLSFLLVSNAQRDAPSIDVYARDGTGRLLRSMPDSASPRTKWQTFSDPFQFAGAGGMSVVQLTGDHKTAGPVLTFADVPNRRLQFVDMRKDPCDPSVWFVGPAADGLDIDWPLAVECIDCQPSERARPLLAVLLLSPHPIALLDVAPADQSDDSELMSTTPPLKLSPVAVVWRAMPKQAFTSALSFAYWPSSKRKRPPPPSPPPTAKPPPPPPSSAPAEAKRPAAASVAASKQALSLRFLIGDGNGDDDRTNNRRVMDLTLSTDTSVGRGKDECFVLKRTPRVLHDRHVELAGWSGGSHARSGSVLSMRVWTMTV
jgi:hypothetical protein